MIGSLWFLSRRELSASRSTSQSRRWIGPVGMRWMSMKSAMTSWMFHGLLDT
jgi:hypothetical protein